MVVVVVVVVASFPRRRPLRSCRGPEPPAPLVGVPGGWEKPLLVATGASFEKADGEEGGGVGGSGGSAAICLGVTLWGLAVGMYVSAAAVAKDQ